MGAPEAIFAAPEAIFAVPPSRPTAPKPQVHIASSIHVALRVAPARAGGGIAACTCVRACACVVVVVVVVMVVVVVYVWVGGGTTLWMRPTDLGVALRSVATFECVQRSHAVQDTEAAILPSLSFCSANDLLGKAAEQIAQGR